MKNEYELKIKGGDGGLFPDVYIASDLHYNHKNLCAGISDWKGARPFALLDDMNQTIVNNINNTVKREDILILAGDVAFQGPESVDAVLKQINCQNKYLVYGNHDEHILNNELSLRKHFMACTLKMKLSIGQKHRFIIHHEPIASWHGLKKGWMHLYGHLHLPPSKRLCAPGRCMDIGMDGHPEFRPYHIINECVPLLKDREIRSWFTNDHHLSNPKGK